MMSKQRNVVPRRRMVAGAAGAAIAVPLALSRALSRPGLPRAAATQANGRAEWVNAIAYGADPTGAADSAAAINSALAAGPAFLPWGTYLVGTPVTVPRGGVLASNGVAMDLAQGPSYGGGAVLSPSPSFAGPAVISAGSGAVLSGFMIDGSAIGARGAAVAGIAATGQVTDVFLADIAVYNVPGDGVRAVYSGGNPFSWRLDQVTVNAAGGTGFNVGNLTDSTFINCEAIGCTGTGWYLHAMGNCQLHGCRAEWNGGPGGFYISGPASGLTLTGCSTDRNREHGLYIDASGNAPVLISGFRAHRDGASSTSDGYAGVTLNGAACPVLIDGLVATPGTDDDGTGNDSPQYGINMWGTITYLSLTNALLHGVTAGVLDNTRRGSVIGYHAVATRTGTITAPSVIARLADTERG
ncbi:MAG TPA: right-handed parallel beta-helix repeat-containing protein [Trebonia sp.]